MCSEGFATYKTADVQNNDFTVTKEFATAVCQLPQTYDIVQYIKFLETWGTVCKFPSYNVNFVYPKYMLQ